MITVIMMKMTSTVESDVVNIWVKIIKKYVRLMISMYLELIE